MKVRKVYAVKSMRKRGGKRACLDLVDRIEDDRRTLKETGVAIRIRCRISSSLAVARNL